MNEALFSSATEEWATPDEFFRALDAEFHFTLDPCSTDENAKCAKHYTKAQDGLKQDWTGERVFCNPPYGREMPKWIAKCAEHGAKGGGCGYVNSSKNRHEGFSRLHIPQGRDSIYPWKAEIRRFKEQRPVSVDGGYIRWEGRDKGGADVSVFGEHFGENLRRIRKSRKMTRRSLAEVVGLHENHIYNLERGRYLPRICTAQRVADGLGVPMAELLRDGKKRPRVILNDPTFDRATRRAIP